MNMFIHHKEHATYKPTARLTDMLQIYNESKFLKEEKNNIIMMNEGFHIVSIINNLCICLRTI